MKIYTSVGAIAARHTSQQGLEQLPTTLCNSPHTISMKLFQTGAGNVLSEIDYLQCEKESIGKHVK